MIPVEVSDLEENNELNPSGQQGYEPRPAWQVWAARIGALLFAGLIALQIISIARGGL